MFEKKAFTAKGCIASEVINNFVSLFDKQAGLKN